MCVTTAETEDLTGGEGGDLPPLTFPHSQLWFRFNHSQMWWQQLYVSEGWCGVKEVAVEGLLVGSL